MADTFLRVLLTVLELTYTFLRFECHSFLLKELFVGNVVNKLILFRIFFTHENVKRIAED